MWIPCRPIGGRDLAAAKSGEEMTAHDGQCVRWSNAKADENGWLEDAALRGGYAFAKMIRHDGKWCCSKHRGMRCCL